MNLKLAITRIRAEGRTWVDAVTFYTIVPLPAQWQGNFTRIAHWSPWLGSGIGGILVIFEFFLRALSVPLSIRAVAMAIAWLGLTGGLHLDGAMDTADGLGVDNPQRRLEVMQDSHTGAFGVMAAIAILGLKTAAIAAEGSGWGLILAASWGRWGQLMAIALYPYLKPTGKGAFHKRGMRWPRDVLWGSLGVLLVEGMYGWSGGGAIVTLGMGVIIALGMGYYYYHQLGGQTGDSYGAIVEWTEALFICGFASGLD
jgi:adenosylcobinamide-GDP ribazoletransferase